MKYNDMNMSMSDRNRFIPPEGNGTEILGLG